MGHIQAEHGELDAGLEHDLGGVRVGEDVELGRRRDVALADGAAHQHDLADVAHDVGRPPDRGGDIGERPERAERHGARPCPQRRDDRVDRVRIGEPRPGLRQLRAIQPGAAVDMLGGDHGALQRPVAARMHRDVVAAGELDDLARVPFGQRQGDVAGDRGDRQHLQLLGRGQGQEDRERVVLSRVAVDDDRSWRHGSPWTRPKRDAWPPGASDDGVVWKLWPSRLFT